MFDGVGMEGRKGEGRVIIWRAGEEEMGLYAR